MAERNWFFASEGKQQGPYPEQQFRELVARGAVTAETLVWSEGMSGWQKAGEVPGLRPSAGGPPGMPRAAGVSPAGLASHGSLVADLPTFGLFGRVLLVVIGSLLVIPAPWVATILYRWVAERIRVPGRPNISFTGQPLDIWWAFMLISLTSYAGVSDLWWLPLVLIPVNAFLAWMVIRWIISNIASDGQKLPLTFEGSPLAYIGWYAFLYVSVITIIGWAWVTTAWLRWMCRNIAGTQRAVVFNGSGWNVLWRTLVTVLACIFIIPIPWVMKWLVNWYISQFELVERTS